MSRVIVLHAPAPGHASPEWERGLLLRLPYARRLALESRDREARRASLGGTALLFEAAGRLGFDDVGSGELRFPEGAKPSVAGGPYFSISHTARRVACAASRDCDIGLDHEEFAGAQAPARLRHWTAVEATLKAAGAGLRRSRAVEIDPELRFSRLDDTEYQLVPLDLGPGVVACLALSSHPHAIEIEPLECVGT
jgi:phosphopantetheinyl transferase